MFRDRRLNLSSGIVEKLIAVNIVGGLPRLVRVTCGDIGDNSELNSFFATIVMLGT